MNIVLTRAEGEECAAFLRPGMSVVPQRCLLQGGKACEPEGADGRGPGEVSGEVSVFSWLATTLGQLHLSLVPGSLCPSCPRWTWVGPAKFSLSQPAYHLRLFFPPGVSQ